MPKLKNTIRRSLVGFGTLVLVLAYPLPALADGATSVCGLQITGTTSPTGADAGTYTYNKDTCLWENDYYTWNPVTKVYTPKFSQTYTYNSATGKYDTTTYVYSPAAGKYLPVTKSVATPPAGAAVIGGPPAPTSTITNTGAGSTNTINNDDTSGGTSSISGTGNGSSNTIDNNGGSDANLNNQNSVTVDNTVDSTAKSGNASVSQTTVAGDATSGNAQATATVVNLLQSNTSLQGNVATFTYNIYGNVQGDISINPSELNNVSPSVSPDSQNNTTINTSNDATINNDITLSATSGDAKVSGNTVAGDATSGTAAAMADIVNVINSIISSGQSFTGTINIYGNYDGDILLPQDTLNKLLASNFPTVNATVSPDGTISTISNTGEGSLNAINNNNSTNTDINNTNNTNIKNNVDLSATSGDAKVSGNTVAGDATSGGATTNLVLLNLTGQQVICGDALLVFVNVLGNWVGMIVNAPSGSTSAALGGGNCSTASLSDGSNTTLNSTNNSTINNNVTLAVKSGDAKVTDNTRAGNATSGNATASANIANIANSSLSFSSWFGILFINVFGSWNGSFGIDTSAGGFSTHNNAVGNSGGSGGSTPGQVKVFKFVPTSSGGSSGSYHSVLLASSGGGGANISNTGANSHNGIVMGANTSGPSSPSQPGLAIAQSHWSYLWTAGSLGFLLAIIGFEQLTKTHKESTEKAKRYLRSITVQPLKKT